MYFLATFFIIFFTQDACTSSKKNLENKDDLYAKGRFLSVGATSFSLDKKALLYPSAQGKENLFKTITINDQKLMFYLSQNKGLTLEEKFYHRLQAFQCVMTHYSEETTLEREEIIYPLFRFTGGTWVRLQGIVWGHGKRLKCKLCSPRAVKERDIKYMSPLGLPYYRFLSRKERQIQEGSNPLIPRDQKTRKDRTPNPRSLRKGKQKNRRW